MIYQHLFENIFLDNIANKYVFWRRINYVVQFFHHRLHFMGRSKVGFMVL